MSDHRPSRRDNSLGFLILVALLLLHGAALAQAPFRILLSNDDGIQAPGIQALFAKLVALGEVTVAAPAANQSGVGHAMTFSGPIAVESFERGGGRWFSIAASPATCVRMALTSLSLPRPDVVVSGINRGENTGVVTFSSGTVACAREAAFRGIPAIAVSLETNGAMDYGAAADFLAALIADLKEHSLPPGTYLNVNIPALPRERIKGVLVTRQDRRPADERYEAKVAADGKTTYLSVYRVLTNGEEGCDTWALGQGFISLTPLSIDQTRLVQIEGLKTWEVVKSWKWAAGRDRIDTEYGTELDGEVRHMKKAALLLIASVFVLSSTLFSASGPAPLQGEAVNVQKIEPFAYFSMRFKGSFTQIPEAISKMFQEAQLQNAVPTGPLIGIYYNSPQEVAPEQLDWEIGFPTSEQTVVQPPLEKKIWNFTQVAVSTHQGPYEKTVETITKMMEWMAANGYTPAGPMMERYMDMEPESVKPELRKTEVWIPCQKK